jgi:deazaflavin-dependent oxidoreductase (nitroreductase family)
MSDKSSEREAIEAAAEDGNFLMQHIKTYIGTKGAQGHIIDLSGFGGFKRVQTLLLRTIGKKSGKPRFAPLVYGCYGGEWVIIGSNGGAPKDPAWIVNLRANPDVRFQVGSQAFQAEARFLEGEELDRVFAYMRTVSPSYDSYGDYSQGRSFPVVSLKPIEDIAPFELSELG